MGGVRSTIVRDGRTIRTWEESRESGTYIRQFYIQYECIALGVCDRKIIRIANTKEEASLIVRDWESRCEKHYNTKSLRTDRVPYSHEREVGFYIVGPAKIFALEISAGEAPIFEGYENETNK